MSPDQIRAQVRATLAALSELEVEAKSDLIQTRLNDLVKALPNIKKIGCYIPLKSEVQLGRFFDLCIKAGKNLAFPKIVDANAARMDFFEVTQTNFNQWPKNNFGIPEPPTSQILNPNDIQLIIVPGMAFDSQGNRIGRGKGYYDRFLTRTPKSKKVGLAFECQIFPKIDQQKWDQPVNLVITEKNSYPLSK